MATEFLAEVIAALRAEMLKGEDNFEFSEHQPIPYNLHDDPQIVVIPPYDDGYVGFSSVILRWNRYQNFYSVINSYGECKKFTNRSRAIAYGLKV